MFLFSVSSVHVCDMQSISYLCNAMTMLSCGTFLLGPHVARFCACVSGAAALSGVAAEHLSKVSLAGDHM